MLNKVKYCYYFLSSTFFFLLKSDPMDDKIIGLLIVKDPFEYFHIHVLGRISAIFHFT